VQTVQVDRTGDNAGVFASSLKESTCCSGEVSATGVGDDNRIGFPAKKRPGLQRDLVSKAFNSANAVGCIQAGVEISG